MENKEGRGPCYLQTRGTTSEQEHDLYKAYLNMAPAQTLRWLEQGKGPAEENVEIQGTEPYIVGGHTGSGYWIDTQRATTIPGLYAAGDVAGGSPQKYVTGCFVEGEIAAIAALDYIQGVSIIPPNRQGMEAKLTAVNKFFRPQAGLYTVEEVEEAMQQVMDDYAGGISAGYAYNTAKLQVAKKRIGELLQISYQLNTQDLHQLMLIFDRLYVCQTLIEHLETRQETRWPAFQQNADYRQKDDQNWLKFVNSRLEGGAVKIILRDLVKKDDRYEHKD
jgi:adenylylsulfate reductase subunit A